MTTATKPGAPFQGPSWSDVIADPSALHHDPTGRNGRGKKDFSEELHPRDDHGQFTETGGSIPGVTAGDPGTPTATPSFTRNEPAESRIERLRPYDGQYVMAFMRQGPSHDGEMRVHDMTVVVGEDVLDPMDIRQVAVYGNRKSKDFSEELHPRDDHGRFTDTGSLGDTAIQQGGFSLSLAGDRPHSGWMVSKLGSERSFSIEQLSSGQDMSFVPGNPWHDNFTNEVGRFVSDHLDDLQAKGAYLGGWVDSGRLFLDVSYNFADRGEAEQFARENQQFAMYNAGTGEYVTFEQQRRAASREAEEQKADVQAKDNEKVLLKVDKDQSAEEIAARLHRALFG